MRTTDKIARTITLVVSLATLSAAGCGVSIEAELPDVEVTQRGIVFPGVAGSDVSGDQSMAKSFSQQHDKIALPDGVNSDVRTLSVKLHATAGVRDLSFIHHLRVTMSANDGSEAMELGVYEPATGATVGNDINLTTLNPINIFDAWNTESATFTLEVVGALPETDWTGDVIVHFSGRVKYTY
jgi:hypothetical protein